MPLIRLTIPTMTMTTPSTTTMLPSDSGQGRIFQFVVAMPDADIDDGVTEEECLSPDGTLGKVESTLRKLHEDGYLSYVVVSLEHGDQRKRLHFQGFLMLRLGERTRSATLAKLITPKESRAHANVDRMGAFGRPRDPDTMRKYAMGYSKESKLTERKADWIDLLLELGTFEAGKEGKPKRTDLDIVRDGVADGEFRTLRDINAVSTSTVARCPNFIDLQFSFKADDQARAYKKRVLASKKMSVWQYWLHRTVHDSPVDDRAIYFVVDHLGSRGKTLWSSYQDVNGDLDVCYMKPAKKADMAMMFDPTCQLLIMDVTRTCEDFTSHIYNFLEEVKDGQVVSSKYQSRMKVFEPPHVVVFMNFDVDIGQPIKTEKRDWKGDMVTHITARSAPLSHGRYRVWNLDSNPKYSMTWRPEDSEIAPFDAKCPGWLTCRQVGGGNLALDGKYYYPPFVPTAGPQFNGDMAGDGPVTLPKTRVREGDGTVVLPSVVLPFSELFEKENEEHVVAEVGRSIQEYTPLEVDNPASEVEFTYTGGYPPGFDHSWIPEGSDPPSDQYPQEAAKPIDEQLEKKHGFHSGREGPYLSDLGPPYQKKPDKVEEPRAPPEMSAGDLYVERCQDEVRRQYPLPRVVGNDDWHVADWQETDWTCDIED